MARPATAFRLLRYFSITSLVSIAVAAVLLGALYRHFAVKDVIEGGERSNVALSRALANTLRPQYAGLLAGDRGADTRELHRAVAESVKGLTVVKVKIYDRSGRTIYSSEARQIGEDKSGNAGFIAARGGNPASELTHRGSFSAFEQVVENLDVLSSYVPAVRGGAGEVEAVFEIYVVVLSALYGVLFLVVRHADAILRDQEAARARNELELRDARDAVGRHATELEASLKEMEAFSYSVSHDLRSPLGALNGFTQLLRMREAERLTEDGRKLLGFVEANASRMAVLIEALLELSRLSRQTLTHRQVAIGVLAREVIEELQAADQAAVKLGELPDCVGESRLLKQVWANLVDNALKFSRGKTPARIEIGFDAAASAYFVRDNGAGFDMKHAAKLFGVFERLHTEAEFPGTGIGLAIVGRIVARHGGRIWANATPGEGATFFFTLPAAPGAI
jgi:signal transduction histidine kinase